MSDLLAKCPVCHALLDEEDLFCANCGTEAPQREAQRRDDTQTVTHNFECGGCGASMSYSAQAGSLVCPFCGSVKLVEKRSTRALAPSKVVPMVVSRDAAVASMRRWSGAGFWRPGDLSEKALVVSMTPVFVPYWVFEAATHTLWTADTSNTPAGRGATGIRFRANITAGIKASWLAPAARWPAKKLTPCARSTSRKQSTRRRWT